MFDGVELSAASSRGCPPRQVDDDGGRPAGAQARTANESATTCDCGPTARPRSAPGPLDVLYRPGQIREPVSETMKSRFGHGGCHAGSHFLAMKNKRNSNARERRRKAKKRPPPLKPPAALPQHLPSTARSMVVGRVFLVLTGACQFGHGVGGFTTNFIHSPEDEKDWLFVCGSCARFLRSTCNAGRLHRPPTSVGGVLGGARAHEETYEERANKRRRRGRSAGAHHQRAKEGVVRRQKQPGATGPAARPPARPPTEFAFVWPLLLTILRIILGTYTCS